MKSTVGGFLVLASLMFLSACAFMRPVGPCYGYGCPVFDSAPNTSSKSASLLKLPRLKHHEAKTQAATAQAKKQPVADAQSNHGN
jgi:hypothetical protein